MLNAILFNDTSYEKHHGSQLVVRQIYALAANAGIRILFSCPMRYDWRKDEQLKAEIATADLCFINGEGTFHDDAKQALMLAELAPYCRGLGVPCFLINSVWQRNPKLLEYARIFSRIYLRDTLSQQDLEQQGVSACVVPDLTLSYRHPIQGKKRQGLVVNGSVYVERTSEAWHAVNSLGGEDIRYVSIKTLPPVQRGKGFPVYFWKSVVRRLQSNREWLLSRLRHLPAVLDETQVATLRWRYAVFDFADFMKILEGSVGVITGRFHCATLCMLTETPFYAIASNTHKIQALLDAAGLHGRIFPSYDAALSHRKEIAFSVDELISLRQFVRGCENQAQAMFNEMAAYSDAKHPKSPLPA